MSGRVYRIPMNQLAIGTSKQDLWAITASSTIPFWLEEIRLDPIATSVAEYLMSLSLFTGSFTAGSGGTSVTPAKTLPNDAAAGATSKIGNTTQTVVGSGTKLQEDAGQREPRQRLGMATARQRPPHRRSDVWLPCALTGQHTDCCNRKRLRYHPRNVLTVGVSHADQGRTIARRRLKRRAPRALAVRALRSFRPPLRFRGRCQRERLCPTPLRRRGADHHRYRAFR